MAGHSHLLRFVHLLLFLLANLGHGDSSGIQDGEGKACVVGSTDARCCQGDEVPAQLSCNHTYIFTHTISLRLSFPFPFPFFLFLFLLVPCPRSRPCPCPCPFPYHSPHLRLPPVTPILSCSPGALGRTPAKSRDGPLRLRLTAWAAAQRVRQRSPPAPQTLLCPPPSAGNGQQVGLLAPFPRA